MILTALSRGIRLGWENPLQQHLNIATSSTWRSPSACKRVVPGFEDQERFNVCTWETLVITRVKKRKSVESSLEEKNIIRDVSTSSFMRKWTLIRTLNLELRICDNFNCEWIGSNRNLKTTKANKIKVKIIHPFNLN